MRRLRGMQDPRSHASRVSIWISDEKSSHVSISSDWKWDRPPSQRRRRVTILRRATKLPKGLNWQWPVNESSPDIQNRRKGNNVAMCNKIHVGEWSSPAELRLRTYRATEHEICNKFCNGVTGDGRCEMTRKSGKIGMAELQILVLCWSFFRIVWDFGLKSWWRWWVVRVQGKSTCRAWGRGRYGRGFRCSSVGRRLEQSLE